jgi:hypothetical protein
MSRFNRLAKRISRCLDGDADDRRRLAEALASTGLEESGRLFDLAELVRWIECQPHADRHDP